MKVKNYPGAVGDNRQLLDVSSDYNNFSNLAYFISEYRKAIAEEDEETLVSLLEDGRNRKAEIDG